MHLQPKLYQIQSGDWPTCRNWGSNPGPWSATREAKMLYGCHTTTREMLLHKQYHRKPHVSPRKERICSLLLHKQYHRKPRVSPRKERICSFINNITGNHVLAPVKRGYAHCSFINNTTGNHVLGVSPRKDVHS